MYFRVEVKAIGDKLPALWSKYYESKKSLKNINILNLENYGGETFISEKLAIFNLLQRTKEVVQRCHLLSHPSDLITFIQLRSEYKN